MFGFSKSGYQTSAGSDTVLDTANWLILYSELVGAKERAILYAAYATSSDQRRC